MQITSADPPAQPKSARGDVILNAALAWAAKRRIVALGLNKKPCYSKEEGGRGYLDASSDPDVIVRQFSHPAARMIGLPTGATNGVDAVDVDPRHGGNIWLTENRYRLPHTRIHRTRSGGQHLLFIAHPGMRCSQSRISRGVDVRAGGGYIVIPPSPGYTVEVAAPLAPWPDWLLEAALPPPKPERPEPIVTPYVPVGKPRLEGVRRAILDRVSRAADGERHFARLKAGRALGGIAAELGFGDKTAIAWIMAALPTASGSKAHDEAARKTIQAGLDDGRKTPLVLEERPHPVLRGAK